MRLAADDDPGNKIRDGLYIDDERKSVIEPNDDGSATFHRYYGGRWNEHQAGRPVRTTTANRAPTD